jgi:predicted membrane protein
MRVIGKLIRTFFVLSFIAGIVSAIGAFYAKGRLFSKGEPSDDELELVAIYEPRNFASTATAFRHASYTAWYGGGTLDLRGATLDPGGATLEVRAIFGGFRLVIPETWRVQLETVGVFGGIGDARDASKVDPIGPLLVIHGFAIFGGVGIVADAPDLDEEALAAPTFEEAPLPA